MRGIYARRFRPESWISLVQVDFSDINNLGQYNLAFQVILNTENLKFST